MFLLYRVLLRCRDHFTEILDFPKKKLRKTENLKNVQRKLIKLTKIVLIGYFSLKRIFVQ